jgi:hypothetical protein
MIERLYKYRLGCRIAMVSPDDKAKVVGPHRQPDLPN